MATPSTLGATVLIVEDHPVMQHGLTALLELEAWVGRVVQALTAQAGRELVITHRPDVAVVDLGLPDADGVDLIRVLRQLAPDCPIVVLTATRDDAEAVRACLAAGASGYVVKDTRSSVIVQMIETVFHGGVVLGPQVASQALTGGTTALPSPLDRLSPGDVRLLTLLACGDDNGQIASALGITEKTVRNRISGILATINVANRVQAARLAQRHGLLAPPST